MLLLFNNLLYLFVKNNFSGFYLNFILIENQVDIKFSFQINMYEYFSY